MKIKLIHDDICFSECDAIINPSNTHCYMGGGVAGALKKKGGTEIEEAAVHQGPIPIGEAIITQGGKLRVPYVIHAPTMEQPEGISNVYYINEALHAAFNIAKEKGLRRIALPGMGTGIGGVSFEEAADIMTNVLAEFWEDFDDICITDTELKFLGAMEKMLRKKGLLKT